MNEKQNKLSAYVKEMRKTFNLTQVDIADKAWVGLRFVGDLEQGKTTLRMDKVNLLMTNSINKKPAYKNFYKLVS